jgi:hypothetical protein
MARPRIHQHPVSVTVCGHEALSMGGSDGELQNARHFRHDDGPQRDEIAGTVAQQHHPHAQKSLLVHLLCRAHDAVRQ